MFGSHCMLIGKNLVQGIEKLRYLIKFSISYVIYESLFILSDCMKFSCRENYYFLSTLSILEYDICLKLNQI